MKPSTRTKVFPLGVFRDGHELDLGHPRYRAAVPLERVPQAIGTDINHMHPSASGAALGEGSLREFRHFVASVARLAGGVYLNCGSAVVLPEVFLKAVGIMRNGGVSLDGLTTVNLNFARHYGPETKVVSRPAAGIGRGYSLVGHNEIMIPLPAAALGISWRKGRADLAATSPRWKRQCR